MNRNGDFNRRHIGSIENPLKVSKCELNYISCPLKANNIKVLVHIHYLMLTKLKFSHYLVEFHLISCSKWRYSYCFTKRSFVTKWTKQFLYFEWLEWTQIYFEFCKVENLIYLEVFVTLIRKIALVSAQHFSLSLFFSQLFSTFYFRFVFHLYSFSSCSSMSRFMHAFISILLVGLALKKRKATIQVERQKKK